MRRIFVCLQPCCVGRIASYATETTRLKTDKKTSKVGGLFVSSCLSTINGCATYTDGWVYDEKTDKYLSGQEIKSLVSGNTIVYFDSNGTKEYYDKSGIMYIFYQTDDEYHNSHWCIKENKLCIDSSGLKLICPKISNFSLLTGN